MNTKNPKELKMITEKLTELKEKSALTNQQIADLSGVPLSTATRIFSGQTDNPSFQTISDIVNVMGGSLDEIVGVNKKTPTPITPDNPQERLIKFYQDALSHKNKWIKTLFICLCTLVAVMMIILLFDIFNPNIGFVKY